jgi:hypothetical protein
MYDEESWEHNRVNTNDEGMQKTRTKAKSINKTGAADKLSAWESKQK